MTLVQGQFKTSNHLSFSMFFLFRPFTKHPYFLLGSYPLWTIASMFLHISSTFMSLFLYTSPHYLEAFNHLNFLILPQLEKCTKLQFFSFQTSTSQLFLTYSPPLIPYFTLVESHIHLMFNNSYCIFIIKYS